MAKHDWPTIRREYVEGFDKDGRIHRPTLAELSKRHSVRQTDVCMRAAAEGWTAARKEFQTKTREAREAVRIRELAAEGAAFDRRMLRFAGEFMTLVERARKDVAVADAIDHLELARLAQAARHAQVIANVALGLTDPGDTPSGVGATIRVLYDRQPLPTSGS